MSRMRFNSHELAIIAQQKEGRFDKEGILQIKEKQDGLFRKGEVYIPRLFRLRGNLLFYFKTKDHASEVIGLIVLERCVVELDLEEEMEFSFLLVFEGDDRVVHLAASSERERDSWIEHLHISSYECMKMQLENLREQLRARTGRDPIENPEPSELPESGADTSSLSEPFLEMCITCDGLPYNNIGREPDTYASINFVTPPNQQWLYHAHTEVVEKSTCPVYLTTVGFTNPRAVTLSTRIKICVYDVKERMTNTDFNVEPKELQMTQIGTVYFTLSDLLTSEQNRLRLRLNSMEPDDVGHVTILAWQNESHFESLNSMSKDHLERPLKSGGKRLEMLKPLYDNIISKTYRFPTSRQGEELSVHEYMGESRLTYYLPKQLLKLWVEEEKQRIEELQDLGQLIPIYKLEELRLQGVCTCNTFITYYMKALKHYTRMSKGAPFKPSAKRCHKEVEFAPTNLHIQRIYVHNDSRGTCGSYDVTTIGGLTASAQKYKHGGLRRMLNSLREEVSEENNTNSKMTTINKTVNSIKTLRAAIDQYHNDMCRAAVQGDAAELNNAVTIIQDKARQLILVCESDTVQESVDDYYAMRKPQAENNTESRPYSDTFLNLVSSPLRQQGQSRESSPEKTWKWSGTDFVKSPTQEPWDLTRLNTEAAMMCVVSQVEGILKGDLQSTHWLDDLSPLVIKLQRCVEVMCSRAQSALTFTTIKECGPNVALMHTIKYRRDVVFSQAVTVATSAFMTQLRSSVQDEAYLRQLFQIGILMEFESLLSCYGDEAAMLEDMSVGVSDLATVSFKVVQASHSDDLFPHIRGNRTGYVIEIPVPEHMFNLLPKEIQRGHLIRIAPVIFNIGINEQATLAERFGDKSLQENINQESYEKLYAYYEKFVEFQEGTEDHDLANLGQLMRELQVHVVSRKNKNTQTLTLAAEVCRTLNGLRFTNCKSGKDRTSMSVTLEQVRLLQKDHDLAPHVFMQALHCMRSEGVRRQNVTKNCGGRKYAFNAVQLMAFPKLYRPPNGTYGYAES